MTSAGVKESAARGFYAAVWDWEVGQTEPEPFGLSHELTEQVIKFNRHQKGQKFHHI